MTQAPPQPPPSAKELVGNPNLPQGSLFGLPGVTYWSEQVEANDQVSLTLAQGTQTVFQFPSPLFNTDILYREIVDFNITNTVTLAGGTLSTSDYFPYSFVGVVQLSMQNQYNSIDVLNGIDLKLFEILRPQYMGGFQGDNYWEQVPNTDAYSVGANLSTSNAYTSASASILFSIDLPLGTWFDRYFDLDPDGQLRGNLGPARAFVTPQLMAGANRIVIPRITMNPAYAATNDNGPYTILTGSPTFTGSVTVGWQRKVVYQPRSASDAPMLWGWQYSRDAKQYTLSGRSTADILLPTVGQILAVYYRLFDPSAASNGAPINITTAKNVWLQYGSGLYKYQDTSLRAQRRFQRQHNNIILPKGCVGHDLIVDEQGMVSNQNALNTLDTSSCKVHFDFTSTLSNTAYVVIGVESLRYVVQM